MEGGGVADLEGERGRGVGVWWWCGESGGRRRSEVVAVRDRKSVV